jgi:hypothetical protein
MCPSSGENTVPMRHLLFVTLYRWPPWIPDSHPHRVTNTWCRIGKVFSPDDGHIVARNMYRKAINILRKNCAPSWFYLQDYTGMHGQQYIKLCHFTQISLHITTTNSRTTHSTLHSFTKEAVETQVNKSPTPPPPPPKKKNILLTKLKQNMLEKRRAKPTRFVTIALYTAGVLPLSKHYDVTSFQLCSSRSSTGATDPIYNTV